LIDTCRVTVVILHVTQFHSNGNKPTLSTFELLNLNKILLRTYSKISQYVLNIKYFQYKISVIYWISGMLGFETKIWERPRIWVDYYNISITLATNAAQWLVRCSEVISTSVSSH